MAIKVSEELLRDTLKAVDALKAAGVELELDKPAVFYSEWGRNGSDRFKVAFRYDENTDDYIYEVML